MEPYQGQGDPVGTLRSVLAQVDGAVAESVVFDAAQARIHFFCTSRGFQNDQSNRAKLLLARAGFVCEISSYRQFIPEERIQVGPGGVSPSVLALLTSPQQPQQTPSAGSADKLPDVTAGQWDVTPDPGPVFTPYAVKPPTIPAGAYFQDMLFSDAPSGRAVMRCQLQPQRHPSLLLWDLRTGEQIAQCDLPRKEAHLLAFSPDGRQVLIDDQETFQTIGVWQQQGNRLERSHSLQLPLRENTYRLFFPDNATVAAQFSYHDSLDFMDIHGQPKSSRRTNAFDFLAFSPGGRYAFVSQGFPRRCEIFECATSRLVGELDVPLERDNDMSVASFSPDGQRLAALIHEGSTQSRSLMAWDVSTGKLTHWIPLANYPRGTRHRLLWLGQRFVAVDDAGGIPAIALVDLQSHLHVWDYQLQRLWRRSGETGEDPAGRIWMRVESPAPEFGSRLAAISLPRPQDVERIDELLAARDLVLQRGDAVSLEVSIDNRSPVKNFRQTIEKTLQQKLAERGVRVEAGQASVVRASFVHVDQLQTAHVEVFYRKAGIITDWHKLQVPANRVVMDVTIEKDGIKQWQQNRVFGVSSVSPSEEIPNDVCRDDPQYAVVAQPWFRLARWLQAVPWPPELRTQQPPPPGHSGN